MRKVRVLLVDDHALVRAGIACLLKELEGIEIVGQASSGQEALKLLLQYRPHLILMDLSMPGMSGLEVTERIHLTNPNAKVLILSIYVSQELIQQALRAGASGYLGKGINPPELERAIRTVLAGGQYIVTPDASHTDQEETSVIEQKVRELTPRQLQVLQLIAQGYTSREIAQQLHLSFRTVQAYRVQLMRRLNMHDAASLTRLAVKAGLV